MTTHPMTQVFRERILAHGQTVEIKQTINLYFALKYYQNNLLEKKVKIILFVFFL